MIIVHTWKDREGYHVEIEASPVLKPFAVAKIAWREMCDMGAVEHA